jgi:hypothetical protein
MKLTVIGAAAAAVSLILKDVIVSNHDNDKNAPMNLVNLSLCGWLLDMDGLGVIELIRSNPKRVREALARSAVSCV